MKQLGLLWPSRSFLPTLDISPLTTQEYRANWILETALFSFAFQYFKYTHLSSYPLSLFPPAEDLIWIPGKSWVSFPSFLWKVLPLVHYLALQEYLDGVIGEDSIQVFSILSLESLRVGEQLSLGTSRKVIGSYICLKHVGTCQ